MAKLIGRRIAVPAEEWGETEGGEYWGTIVQMGTDTTGSPCIGVHIDGGELFHWPTKMVIRWLTQSPPIPMSKRPKLESPDVVDDLCTGVALLSPRTHQSPKPLRGDVPSRTDDGALGVRTECGRSSAPSQQVASCQKAPPDGTMYQRLLRQNRGKNPRWKHGEDNLQTAAGAVPVRQRSRGGLADSLEASRTSQHAAAAPKLPSGARAVRQRGCASLAGQDDDVILNGQSRSAKLSGGKQRDCWIGARVETTSPHQNPSVEGRHPLAVGGDQMSYSIWQGLHHRAPHCLGRQVPDCDPAVVDDSEYAHLHDHANSGKASQANRRWSSASELPAKGSTAAQGSCSPLSAAAPPDACPPTSAPPSGSCQAPAGAHRRVTFSDDATTLPGGTSPSCDEDASWATAGRQIRDILQAVGIGMTDDGQLVEFREQHGGHADAGGGGKLVGHADLREKSDDSGASPSAAAASKGRAGARRVQGGTDSARALGGATGTEVTTSGLPPRPRATGARLPLTQRNAPPSLNQPLAGAQSHSAHAGMDSRRSRLAKGAAAVGVVESEPFTAAPKNGAAAVAAGLPLGQFIS